MVSYDVLRDAFPAEQGPPPGVIITHPNRDKPVVQATRVTVSCCCW